MRNSEIREVKQVTHCKVGFKSISNFSLASFTLSMLARSTCSLCVVTSMWYVLPPSVLPIATQQNPLREAQSLLSSSHSYPYNIHPLCTPVSTLLPLRLLYLGARPSLHCSTLSFLRARRNFLHLGVSCSVWRIINIGNLFQNNLNIFPFNSQMLF